HAKTHVDHAITCLVPLELPTSGAGDPRPSATTTTSPAPSTTTSQPETIRGVGSVPGPTQAATPESVRGVGTVQQPRSAADVAGAVDTAVTGGANVAPPTQAEDDINPDAEGSMADLAPQVRPFGSTEHGPQIPPEMNHEIE